ncbi:NAD(+) diphosphatase [Dokdonella sp.]|uniref:NAD(+) diphosphatase n=1 Tax=Dokdonella sp. TaxID=2291710 RepID=UPI0026196BC4|nr:NAD(+) diphosphatase [Dokdonella sp.]
MSHRVNVFAGHPLERNAELRDDPEWGEAQLSDERARFILVADDGRALCTAARDGLRLLDARERREFAAGTVPTYLGADTGGPLCLLHLDATSAGEIATALGADFVDLRGAGLHLPAFDSGLFAYARAYAHWHARTRWCATCGAPLRLVALGHRALCTNPECAIEHFPRVDPAMIVIVGFGDRCLLGRQATWSANRYSTLAGFVEPGESLEDAVRREVFEESGVRVGSCSYHSSQPWPFPASLMLGFTAEAVDPTIRLGTELCDARWFSVDELVRETRERRLILPPRVSVSHELIADWLRSRSGLELAELQSGDAW